MTNKSLREWKEGDNWDPLISLSDPFSSIFKGFFDSVSPYYNEKKALGFSPSINVEEKDEAFLVTAEIPGVNEKDIEVSLEDGRLTLSGHKKEDYNKEEKGVKYVGRSYGSFTRVIPFNVPIKEDAISADLEGGILKLVLPKDKEEVKARKIAIRSK